MMRIRGRSSLRRKWLFIAIGAIVLVAAVAIGAYLYISRPVTTNNPPVTTVSNEPAPVSDGIVRMSAMGDMLAHDTINANARTGDGYDYARYFANILPAYVGSDVVFCNQEGLSSGEIFGISGYPSFNAPTKFAADLQSGAGCNAINLANNHMGDKGVSAIDATIDVWAGLKPLMISGANKTAADQENVSFATVKGIKFGFVSFMDFNNNTNTPDYSINDYHDEALVRRLVTQARTGADVVVVSMHWGTEDSNNVDMEQYNEAKLLSSLGVDVIIGTGPHVLQKTDVINRDDGGKTVVWYSLGNMLSSQLNIRELIGGIAGFDISKGSSGKVTVDNLTFTPTYMHYEWTAQQSAAGDLSARKNAMIYLLNSAAEPLSRSLFGTTVAEQKQYVIDTLGSAVTVK